MGSNVGDAMKEAERMLGIAEKLLGSGDFAASRNLAKRALESITVLTNGAEQVIAVADVLQSSHIMINNHINPYAVLQLDPSGCDPSTILAHYTRLASCIRDAQGRIPFATEALRIVSDAWDVLSDPSKKSLLDAQGEEHERASFRLFLTSSCHYCGFVFQYDRAYLGRNIQCQTCRQVFRAVELAAAGLIVPGNYILAPAAHSGSSGGNFNPLNPPRQSTAAAAAGATTTMPPPAEIKEKVVARRKPSKKRTKTLELGGARGSASAAVEEASRLVVEDDLLRSSDVDLDNFVISLLHDK